MKLNDLNFLSLMMHACSMADAHVSKLELFPS